MMNSDILEFVTANQYMTLACVDKKGLPYCFNCFYHFDQTQGVLLFASSPNGSHHVELLKNMTFISGSILPNCMPEKYIQGLQLIGHIIFPHQLSEDLQEQYRHRFPESTRMPHEIWGVAIHMAKLTDNSKGFGYKSFWKKCH